MNAGEVGLPPRDSDWDSGAEQEYIYSNTHSLLDTLNAHD